MNRLALYGMVASAALGCAAETGAGETARVRVLNALPSAESGDVQYMAAHYPADDVEFAGVSPEFAMPAGAHPVALVLEPDSDELPPCRDAQADTLECTPPAVMASLLAQMAADGRYLIIFAERSPDGREGLLVPLREAHDRASSNDGRLLVRYVHAMPSTGSVSIEGGGSAQDRLGFRAATDYRVVLGSGLDLVIRDDDGNVLTEGSVDLASIDRDARTWTVVIVGDGSSAGPFTLVPVPG
jgi:hypothetical protein